MFSRSFKKNGPIPLSTYMKCYKRGDIVDIKVGPGMQISLRVPFNVFFFTLSLHASRFNFKNNSTSV